MSFKNNSVKRPALFGPHLHVISKSIFPLNSILKKNDRGVSLVELVIIIGILGGVSLLVMNLTKQTNKSSTKYQFDSEILLVTNEINGMLSDPNRCLTTFTNATQAAYPANPVLDAVPANITNPSGIAGIPSISRRYTLTGGPYGNGGIKIESYSLDLSVTPDPVLTINFQKKAILGSGTIPKTIKLQVEKNGSGIITTCRAISTASTDIWSHGTGVNGNDIFYAGKVGIGISTPSVQLDIDGGIRSGSSTVVTACGLGKANGEGTTRYNYTTHAMEYCNGTSWTSAGATSSSYMLTHAGSNNTAVDCSATSPGPSWTFSSRVCVLSNGPCISDVCLWVKL